MVPGLEGLAHTDRRRSEALGVARPQNQPLLAALVPLLDLVSDCLAAYEDHDDVGAVTERSK